MLGYLKPSFKNAPQVYKKEYKAFYCGLCHTLKSRYGYVSVSCLNYELTLFLIIFHGLSYKEKRFFTGSCALTPFVPVRYVDYLKEEFNKAADLSVIVGNYEVVDNINDEKSLKWKMADALLSPSVKKSIKNLNFDLSQIDVAIKAYYEEENSEDVIFYKIVELSGKMIEKIILPIFDDFEDEVKMTIAELARLLGEWIYLVDACDDEHMDKIKNKFNPLCLLENKKDICDIIASIELRINAIVKRLPLVNYRELIEFILVETLPKKSSEVLSSMNFD